MPCTKTIITWRVGALHVTSFQLTYIIFARLLVCVHIPCTREHFAGAIYAKLFFSNIALVSFTRNQKKVIEHMLSYTNHTRLVRWNYYFKYIHICCGISLDSSTVVKFNGRSAECEQMSFIIACVHSQFEYEINVNYFLLCQPQWRTDYCWLISARST